MLLKEASQILKTHHIELSKKGVFSLSIFGSMARGEPASHDVDILIDFDSKRGLFAFMDLKHFLETLLKLKVDLVTKNALHPALKTQILLEAKLIF